ncbi:MAG: hypothetical protein AB1584_24365 [Pseudomonadota bacterium]
MIPAHALLSGTVTRSDTHQGVHGLRVEAWDAEHPSDKPLGVATTGRDGSWLIDLRGRHGHHGHHDHHDHHGKPDCCECPKVYIKLRDRDCRLIHDGCADRRCCEHGKPVRIDVSLAPQALWWHLSRPLSWERIDEPLLPVRVMQEIEDAIELLQANGMAPGASLALASCATPPIEGFDRLLRDAWDALQGDLDAARRYREVLDALCGLIDGCCGMESPFACEVDKLFDGACCTPPECGCKEPESCACCAPEDCAEGDCGCGEALVSDDKLLLLAMAALHVACGKEEVARRYLEVLLDQFCRFATLGALHKAALGALLGDAAARGHARDLLELLCARCAPARTQERAGCVPRHPLACCTPCLDHKLARCLREAIERWCAIHCYRVCEVRPPRACPGEEVVIVGCGFGERPGRVIFRGHAGSRGNPPGVVVSWCDDRIVVKVPEGAGCGMWLELAPVTVAVCGRYLELRPTGCIEHGFEGTSAEILRFDVKGHTSGDCPLEPGEPLRIRWNTCAADRVRIELIDLATNAIIAVQDPAPANGRWDFTATHFNRTVRLRVRIVASGRCKPPQVSRQIDLVFQKRPNLQVQGLEVTQSIQYYRADQHLTDPSDRGPDNSLRLVTNKTAWVRTYLRSGQDPAFDNGQLAGVNGTLRVERRVGGVWGTVATLPPQNGPVVAEDSYPSYDAERGNIGATLNFVVPAALMTGLLRFTAQVASPFGHCPGNSASGSTQVEVNLQQTLNAAFITIGYNGPNATNTGNIVLAAPTLAQCQAETSWTMRAYPVSGAPNVRIGGTFVTTTPLNDPRSCPGCCSPNWQPLLQQVAALVALDQAANPGTQWVYYGIVAGGIPVNVPGCNGWGATGGLAGQPTTYGHEIGHQFGLPHARCGNAGPGNAAYPVYEPYDLPVDPPGTTNWTMASIGEYGLDINDGSIANPNDAEDFMSYCGPRWMSLYTHQYLINRPGLDPQPIPSGAGAGSGSAPRTIRDPGPGFERDELAILPLIHMLGVIDTVGAVKVVSVARIDTRYLRANGRQTGYIAQHLDAAGRILAQDTVYGYHSEGGGCGCHDCGGDGHGHGGEPAQPILFKAMLRDTAPGALLRIVKDNKVVWERKGAAQPPVIREAQARLGEDQQLALSWRIDHDGQHEDPHAQIEVWVRWSADDGQTWHALTVGLHGNAASVDVSQLPSGPVRFELLANDGFHTARKTTEPAPLPDKPPAVAILYPADGQQVYPDRLIHLAGSAASHSGAAIAPESATWFIDDKPVGVGLDLWVENPGAGRHTVRLEVVAEGLTGTAVSAIEVLAD